MKQAKQSGLKSATSKVSSANEASGVSNIKALENSKLVDAISTNVEGETQLRSTLDDNTEEVESLNKSFLEIAKILKDLLKVDKAMLENSKAKPEGGKEDKVAPNTKKALELHTVKKDTWGGGSVKGFLNATGMIRGGGMIDKALGKREEKQNYLKDMDALHVGPDNKESKAARQAQNKANYKALQGHAATLDKAEKQKSALVSRNMSTSEIDNHIENTHNSMVQLDPRLQEKESAKVTAKETAKAIAKVEDAPKSELDKREKKAEAIPASSEEAANDLNKIQEDQTKLLEEIRDNTKKDKGSEGSKEEGGLSGIGTVIKAIGAGIGAALSSIGSGFSGLGKGAGSGFKFLLQGVAAGLSSLANPMVLAGAAVLGAIGLALWAFKPIVEAIMPLFLKIADVIGNVFMAAIKALPEILEAIGKVIVDVGTSIATVLTAISDGIVKTIGAITESIKTLAGLDAKNMVEVGLALPVIGVGMAALAVGATAAGAAEKVSSGFSTVKKFFVGENVTAPPAAGANSVVVKSEENASTRDSKSGSTGHTVVSAPTTNTTVSNNTIQQRGPIRSGERSSNRLLTNILA